MIRTIVKADSKKISIDLPPDYIGKEIEVIAFTIEEGDHYSDSDDALLAQFASEKILAKDWLLPEEDAAWQNF